MLLSARSAPLRPLKRKPPNKAHTHKKISRFAMGQTGTFFSVGENQSHIKSSLPKAESSKLN